MTQHIWRIRLVGLIMVLLALLGLGFLLKKISASGVL